MPHSSGAEPLCAGAHRRRVLKLLVVSVGLEFVFLSGGIILRGQGATGLVIVRGGGSVIESCGAAPPCYLRQYPRVVSYCVLMTTM